MLIRKRTLGGWGGRATFVARATESVSISRKSTITTTKKATPNGHSLILNLEL